MESPSWLNTASSRPAPGIGEPRDELSFSSVGGPEIQFTTYDPNYPSEPIPLVYDRGTQRFKFPRNSYFKGGRVDVYEIYHAWNY